MSRLLLATTLTVATLLVGALGHTKPAQRAPRAPRATGTTIAFPYEQRRLLHSRNGSGGLAYVTSGELERGAALPVVVFLHGMNADEQMHPWFSSPSGDLRAVVEPLVASGSVAPFILAAPTQTRFATGATVMWPRFDLADFLDATDRALDGLAHVDRGRVIVVGHSAAGCNVEGGILGEGVRASKAMAILAIRHLRRRSRHPRARGDGGIHARPLLLAEGVGTTDSRLSHARARAARLKRSSSGRHRGRIRRSSPRRSAARSRSFCPPLRGNAVRLGRPLDHFGAVRARPCARPPGQPAFRRRSVGRRT